MTRIQGAKSRAELIQVMRAEYGYDMTALLNSIDDKLGSESSSLRVEILGIPTVARSLAATSVSTNVALTAGCKRISIRAVGADIRFKIENEATTATSTSHFIATGERLDFRLPETANIAAIRNASTDGTLEITELG